MEQSIAWIVAAAESFPVRPEEEREEIPPVICLPCLDVKIKFEERIEGATTIPDLAPPSRNGVAKDISVLKSPGTTQDKPDLDVDLVVWMKAAFKKYLILAGKKPSFGRPFGLRMAQVAIGFDVMSEGTNQVKEVFPYFIGALFEILDEAKSTRDLDLLEYLLKNSVYLDVLAEAAEFQTKNGAVSVNFKNYYEDKYLTFITADELIRGRSAKP
jgi:hypothetical protein